jgi:hypothetical protein
MSTSSQYYRVTARVGVPHRYEVDVTVPLVGPAGATGATGATGASGASTWNEISGKPATFPPSAHEHQPDQVYADAAFVSQSGDSSLQIGIYLHNGTDNGRPVYESPTTGDYIWWDSNLDQWYLTSNTDVNLYYLDENADEFPWETDALWSPISPQTGNIEVDQAFLSDISDYGVASVIGLKTSKSGNASSTELVLGSDTRLTNSRTPSSTLAHAASHHTGGSDAVSAFSIGAESIFDATGNTLTGTPVTLTASRARVWTLICFSSTTVTLPTTGVELGDRIVLRGGSPVTAAISISSTGVSDTIQNTDEQFSYTYLSTGTGNRWVKNLVDNHDASRVNSGTFANARINFAAPPAIGSTTPNSAAFTTLSASGDGTINGFVIGATSIAGTTNNRIYFVSSGAGVGSISSGVALLAGSSAARWACFDNGLCGTRGDTAIGWSSSGAPASSNIDTRLHRDGEAGVVAQRNFANPQTFRIYNTFTDATNFERLSLRWASSVAIIGTEKGSVGGSARALEFQTDGVTQLTIDTGGTATFRTSVKLCENTPNGSVTMISGRIAITSPQTGTMILGTGTNALETRYIARRFSSGAGANFEQAFFGWSGTDILLTAQAGGSGTLRGIKLGSASTDLLGFFGATPVVQQAAIADATDAATAITQLNDLLAAMRTLGLIAT